MPPKETTKKATPQIIRPAISEASLCCVPENAVEGKQDSKSKDLKETIIPIKDD